jgi:stearoyl-CoA desaturase (delta-9 desaturase)
MAVTTPTPTQTPSSPQLRDDVQPVANERLDRFLTGTVTVVPFIGLGVAAWQTWNSLLHWHDIVVFAIMYLLCALGVTIGFHRHLTHRAFKTSPFFRGTLAALGSMAIEGPVTAWVADHRKHHTFADEEGDPHSPHVDHGGGFGGTLRGLFHAHVGWLFIHNQRALKTRYAKDLIEDPVVSRIDRTFLWWVLAGLALPFVLGGLISWSWAGAWTGLLWGGAIRMLVVHHVTYSVNSICHVFGRKQYATRDESRNVWWLALPTLGEAWHNSHHAFPTAAHHGMDRRQIDVSGSIITALEKLGIIWDVVRVPEEQKAARRAG